MSLKPLRVKFHMDGSGLFFDESEPIHLDGLLAWVLAPNYCDGVPNRDEKPVEIPLPLGKWDIDGSWGWCASALFPDGETAHGLQFWRKKFRQNRVEITKGSPNLMQGIYREYNMPMSLIICKTMVGYVLGVKKEVKKISRRIKHIGKKRAYGKGKVVGVEVEEISEDISCVHDGHAQRYLPLAGGGRFVRTRSPYWNIIDRVECCNVGDMYGRKTH